MPQPASGKSAARNAPFDRCPLMRAPRCRQRLVAIVGFGINTLTLASDSIPRPAAPRTHYPAYDEQNDS